MCREHVFTDSSLFYRFVDDEAAVLDPDCGDVDPRQCRDDVAATGTRVLFADPTQCRDDVVDAVSYLCQIAPDATMRMILRKPYVPDLTRGYYAPRRRVKLKVMPAQTRLPSVRFRS